MRRSNRLSAVASIWALVALSGCGGGSGGGATAAAPVAVAIPAPPPAAPPAAAPAPTMPTAPVTPGEIHGTGGNDTLNGTANDDVMFGEGGDDTLFGLDGNDRLDGGMGTDTLRGGAGDDTLLAYSSGQSPPDALQGDAGSDVFAFAAHATTRTIGFVPSISAIISDFEPGRDKLQWRFTGTDGDESIFWLGDLPFTGQNRLEVRLVEGLLEADADGDRVPELMIQLTGAITASDIRVEFDPWGY